MSSAVVGFCRRHLTSISGQLCSCEVGTGQSTLHNSLAGLFKSRCEINTVCVKAYTYDLNPFRFQYTVHSSVS